MSWLNPSQYNPDEICSICMQELGIKQAIYQGEVDKTIVNEIGECPHKFHNNCFNNYCEHPDNESKYNKDESLPCPLCSKPLKNSCMDVWSFKNKAIVPWRVLEMDDHVRKIYDSQVGGKTKKKGGKWSLKYKKSINCGRPKGFSQKQYCKYSRKQRKRTRKNKSGMNRVYGISNR